MNLIRYQTKTLLSTASGTIMMRAMFEKLKCLNFPSALIVIVASDPMSVAMESQVFASCEQD